MNTQPHTRAWRPTGCEAGYQHAEALVWPPSSSIPQARDAGLHVCLHCGSGFVAPVSGRPAGYGHHQLLLRCGECSVWRAETICETAVEALEEELDRAAHAISGELARMNVERIATEADVLAAAPERDLIDAGDFGATRS